MQTTTIRTISAQITVSVCPVLSERNCVAPRKLAPSETDFFCLLKVFLLCCLQILVRWTLPRYRYDQLMDLGWKKLLPLALANVVVTGCVIVLVG